MRRRRRCAGGDVMWAGKNISVMISSGAAVCKR